MMLSSPSKALVSLIALVSLLWPTSTSALLRKESIPDFPFKSRPPSLQLTVSRSTASDHLLRRAVAGIEELSFQQQSYNAIIQLGSIPLRVGIDTGSADAWVIASSCTSPQCQSLPTYPLALPSSTYAAINNNQTDFAFSFADGTGGSGFVARETIALANISLPLHAFALIQTSNVSLGQGQEGVSGVLGLGFPRLSQIAELVDNAPPLVARLAQGGAIEYPMFGLGVTATGGTLSLGAIDSAIVQRPTAIEWHEVVPFPQLGKDVEPDIYLQWTLELASIDVDGTAVSVVPTYPVVGRQALALLDIGSSGIFGPYPAVEHIFSLIQDSRLVGEGTWAIPCTTTSVLSFSFGGAKFSLNASDYIIGEAAGTPGSCLAWPFALPPSADGVDWQLGIPFMQKLYSIFSFGIDGKEPPMIGLYTAALASATSSSSSTTSAMPVTASISFSTTAGPFSAVDTTLPNSLLTTPSFTRPPYVFNSSATPLPTIGQTQKTGLGTSTYSPILQPLNATAIPAVAITSTTVVTTDSSGQTVTSVAAPQSTPVLGQPVTGSNGANGVADVRSGPAPVFSVLAVLLGFALW